MPLPDWMSFLHMGEHPQNMHVSDIQNPAPVMELSMGPAIMVHGDADGRDGRAAGFVPLNWGNTLVCSPKAVAELKRQCNPNLLYPNNINRASRIVDTLFGLKLVINEHMPPGQFMLVEETVIGLAIDGPAIKGIFEIDDTPPKPVRVPKAPMNTKTEQWLERWSKR